MHDFAITEHYTVYGFAPDFSPGTNTGRVALFESDRPSRFGIFPGTETTVTSAGSRHRLAMSSIP